MGKTYKDSAKRFGRDKFPRVPIPKPTQIHRSANLDDDDGYEDRKICGHGNFAVECIFFEGPGDCPH